MPPIVPPNDFACEERGHGGNLFASALRRSKPGTTTVFRAQSGIQLTFYRWLT